MSFSIRIVHTPAGSCPIKLKSTEYESVFEWTQLVMDHGRTNNLNYLPSALVFFAQQFFNIFTEDYKIVKNHLGNIFQISSNDELISKINQDKIDKDKINQDKINQDKIDKDKIDANPLENSNEPTKKRMGRPSKKEYSPFRGQIKQADASEVDVQKKYQPKRK